MSDGFAVGGAVAVPTMLGVDGRVLVYVAKKLIAALLALGPRPPNGAQRILLSSAIPGLLWLVFHRRGLEQGWRLQ